MIDQSTDPQEWTPYWIFMQAMKPDGYRLLADNHKAALAAEREKRESIESINRSLATALDAEREKAQDTARAWFERNIDKERNELRQQLAAERVRREQVEQRLRWYEAHSGLAAEREQKNAGPSTASRPAGAV